MESKKNSPSGKLGYIRDSTLITKKKEENVPYSETTVDQKLNLLLELMIKTEEKREENMKTMIETMKKIEVSISQSCNLLVGLAITNMAFIKPTISHNQKEEINEKYLSQMLKIIEGKVNNIEGILEEMKENS